ncbi:hypothetical protein MAV_2731 [Mycobacterium avium 104]|uniref:Uncharacterized protein n=1 Tax=Mycobacterium avium (strain 104) TaxID=243243 RepID=A0A0H3A2S3_MYCA1|nr:hypothetical protein MAV_2731 [Mycobacterium avium 104]
MAPGPVATRDYTAGIEGYFLAMPRASRTPVIPR